MTLEPDNPSYPALNLLTPLLTWLQRACRQTPLSCKMGLKDIIMHNYLLTGCTNAHLIYYRCPKCAENLRL